MKVGKEFKKIMATDKQIAANRQNALKSTGPKTQEGKARIAKNARKLGLFVADTVLLQEDPQEFAAILADYVAEYRPLGPIEEDLVNDLALAMFKKRRYNRMETASLWNRCSGGTRIESTNEMRWLASREEFKSIIRAQAQAQRDFLRTLKILEDMRRQSIVPRKRPTEIQIMRDLRHEQRPLLPPPVLQNKPNSPIEINQKCERATPRRSSWGESSGA
jgi:hypothetical protein